MTTTTIFILGMWVGSQDLKIRQSWVNDLIDPSGVSKPPSSCGIVEEPEPDPSPQMPQVACCRLPDTGVPTVATAAVIRWIHADVKRMQYWKAQAARCRENVFSQEEKNRTKAPEEVATQQLAQILATEVQAGIPRDLSDVYKDLLFGSFKDVNWNQVAQDVLLS